MASTYLTLTQDDGTELNFRKARIKARNMKDGFKLAAKIAELESKGDIEGLLDLRVKFVVDLFDDSSLTEDAIYDGLDSDQLIPELDRIFNDVMGRDTNALGKL